MEKKENKVMYWLLVAALIIIIIVLVLIILKEKKVFPFNNQNTNEIKETNNNKQEEKKEISYNVDEIMKDFKKIYIDNKFDNFDISNINKTDLIITALNNMDDNKKNVCSTDDNKKTVTVDDFNKVLDEIFVEHNKITFSDIQNFEKTVKATKYYNEGLYYIEVIDNKIYVEGLCGREGPIEKFVVEKITTSKADDNHVYVYAKEAFGKWDENAISDDIIYLYYDNYQYKGEYIDKKAHEDDDNDLTWSKYKTYKYTFKLVNNKYYFEKFELSND